MPCGVRPGALPAGLRPPPFLCTVGIVLVRGQQLLDFGAPQLANLARFEPPQRETAYADAPDLFDENDALKHSVNLSVTALN